MALLVIGLILFLGVHSVRIFADPWRSAVIEKRGEGGWKGLYSLISLLGFGLIVWGYGEAQSEGLRVWTPPLWTWHITIALMLVAFVFLTAAYVPRNGIKAKLKDPMILGVKTWALAHLISNGSLAGLVLFGSFLVWAVLDFKSARGRRPAEDVQGQKASGLMTAVTLVVAVLAWALMAFYGHTLLIGVDPFGWMKAG